MNHSWYFNYDTNWKKIFIQFAKKAFKCIISTESFLYFNYLSTDGGTKQIFINKVSHCMKAGNSFLTIYILNYYNWISFTRFKEIKGNRLIQSSLRDTKQIMSIFPSVLHKNIYLRLTWSQKVRFTGGGVIQICYISILHIRCCLGYIKHYRQSLLIRRNFSFKIKKIKGYVLLMFIYFFNYLICFSFFFL